MARVQSFIKLDPVGGFSYQYSLEVNGKPYKTFIEQKSKVLSLLHNYLKIYISALYKVFF
jgi:hypothetical protein